MFLCCGDSLFDLFANQPDHPDAAASAGASAAASNISLAGVVGGSPMNVATGLARLEHQSGYLTKPSSDLFGQRIRNYLLHNGLDISLCTETDLNTTLAMVEKQTDGSAKYAFYINNTADVNIEVTELPGTLDADIKVLHFASYSTVVDPTASTLATLAKREKAQRLISYDPNLRPSIEPDVDRWRETFYTFAATATVIKASDEDIETLLARGKEDQFVSDCFSAGAKLVFITRGPNGSQAFAADGRNAEAAGIPVDVVDTVGAGDTFQAGILHWLAAHGHLDVAGELSGTVDLQGCMKLATTAAAITCTRAGADLPTLKELREFGA